MIKSACDSPLRPMKSRHGSTTAAFSVLGASAVFFSFALRVMRNPGSRQSAVSTNTASQGRNWAIISDKPPGTRPAIR